MSRALPPPLEVSSLVVVPAGVTERSVGVVVRVGAGGATAPCCEDAAVGVRCAAGEVSGVAAVAGREAEAEEEAEAEGEEEAEGEAEAEGEEEVTGEEADGVGVGDGE